MNKAKNHHHSANKPKNLNDIQIPNKLEKTQKFEHNGHQPMY